MEIFYGLWHHDQESKTFQKVSGCGSSEVLLGESWKNLQQMNCAVFHPDKKAPLEEWKTIEEIKAFYRCK